MAIGRSRISIPNFIKKDDIIQIKCIITHPMETGRRKNKKTGEEIPAHYISSVKVFYGGEEVSSFVTGAGVSKNPYFSFYLKATKSAHLRIVFRDNKGGEYEASKEVMFS